MGELLDALAANFEGHEKTRLLLWNRTPKYGNDDPAADRRYRDGAADCGEARVAVPDLSQGTAPSGSGTRTEGRVDRAKLALKMTAWILARAVVFYVWW